MWAQLERTVSEHRSLLLEHHLDDLTTSLVDLVSTNVRHKSVVHLYKCLQVLQSFSSFNHRGIHIYKGIHIHSIHDIQDSVHSIHTRDQLQLWDQLQLRAQPQLPSSFCHSIHSKGIHIHNILEVLHSIHRVSKDQPQHWPQPQLLHWDQPLGLHRQMPQK